MHSNLTYVDTILNQAGINTEAVSSYVRMIALTNASPFWYWFREFLPIWKCRGHACMLWSPEWEGWQTRWNLWAITEGWKECSDAEVCHWTPSLGDQVWWKTWCWWRTLNTQESFRKLVQWQTACQAVPTLPSKNLTAIHCRKAACVRAVVK